MKFKWLAMAAFAAAWALPAEAQMVKAQDPGSLVRALQGAGYSAKLGTDKVGDPMITSGVSGTSRSSSTIAPTTSSAPPSPSIRATISIRRRGWSG